MADLNILTKISASPFEAGCLGALFMCCTPFFLRNFSNSSEMNCGPLSLTNCSQIPQLVNIFLSALIVASEVVFFMGITSAHFECASITIKNILPSNGPA